MVFRSRMRRSAPLRTVKHIVDKQDATTAGAKNNTTLITAADNPTIANTASVQTSSKVNGIFLNVQVIGLGAGGVLNQIYMIIYKNPNNDIATAQIPNANVTGASPFKRHIFHTEMIMMSSSSDDIPQTLFKGVIPIPKHMRAFRFDDRVELQLFSPGGTANICIQCIYKEIR